MASAYAPEKSDRRSQVKLFVTSYSDEFFAERDMIRKEVLLIFMFAVRIYLKLEYFNSN